MRDIRSIAHALVGEPYGNDRVLCPGPGHSPKDRSLSVWFYGGSESEFLAYSFAGQDWRLCGEYVRARLSLPTWQPTQRHAIPCYTRRNYACKNADHANDADKVRWLWSRGISINGSPAETYLKTRGLRGPFPVTLKFLPAHGRHAPALMAALGMANEHDSGLAIAISTIHAVQITALRSSGKGKAGVTSPKKLIGRNANGLPVIVAPPNDLLGLAIAEGVEDALSIHEATGLGAWASRGASRLPALAGAVPDYIDCVTIYADEDPTGIANAMGLLGGLTARGIFAQVKRLGARRAP